MQYIPHLEQAGFEVTIANLFEEMYLKEMYLGRRNPLALVKYLLKRLQQLRIEADIIWLEKEALPWVPWNAERLVWPRKTPIIVDYDDAIFHRYDKSSKAMVRLALGRKIDRVMAAAHAVFAGNDYLAQRARQSGAQSVQYVPTVVDTGAYQFGQNNRDKSQPKFGWIGTPETWNSFARDYASIFEAVALNENVLCRIIGAEQRPRTEIPFEYLPWSEEMEVSLIRGMDIGLMPLPDTPWTRGKCGYKLIQYMACGLPVVASPVGVNSEIVEHGVNGFLASTDQEWREALSTLLANPELRRRMGAAGRKKVEEHYSLQVWGPRVAELLRSVIEKPQNR